MIEYIPYNYPSFMASSLSQSIYLHYFIKIEDANINIFLPLLSKWMHSKIWFIFLQHCCTVHEWLAKFPTTLRHAGWFFYACNNLKKCGNNKSGKKRIAKDDGFCRRNYYITQITLVPFLRWGDNGFWILHEFIVKRSYLEEEKSWMIQHEIIKQYAS